MQLKLENLCKTIGKNTILDDVNLTLSSGHVYGLWGINGSGKTMLMRAMAGLIRPTSGRIAINGQALWKELSFPPSLGFMLEAPAFLDGYTGLEIIKLIAQIKNIIDETDIRNVLEQVGLDPDDKRKYRKYSLGMKQRLGIAAAIMEQPELLLLDEPTNSLDEAAVAILPPIISKLRKNGSLIVVASHDRAFLQNVSDKLFEVRAGRVYEKENG